MAKGVFKWIVIQIAIVMIQYNNLLIIFLIQILWINKENKKEFYLTMEILLLLEMSFK